MRQLFFTVVAKGLDQGADEVCCGQARGRVGCKLFDVGVCLFIEADCDGASAAYGSSTGH